MTLSDKAKSNITLALIAIVPATLSGVLSFCQSTMEMRSKAADTKEHADETSEAVLEGTAPAIEELQGLVIGLQEWSADTAGELIELKDKVAELKEDAQFCKAYIQFASRGRYKEPVKLPEIFPTKPTVPQMKKPRPAAQVPRELSDLKALQ